MFLWYHQEISYSRMRGGKSRLAEDEDSITEEVVALEPVCMYCVEEFSPVSFGELVEVRCMCKSKVIRLQEFEFMCEVLDARKSSAIANGLVSLVTERGKVDKKMTLAVLSSFCDGCPRDRKGIAEFLRGKI